MSALSTSPRLSADSDGVSCLPNGPWELNGQLHVTPGHHPNCPCKAGLGFLASPRGPLYDGPAPAASNCFCLLHQGDKGAIGIPGRVVSWSIRICLGGHCLLLRAGLSSRPWQCPQPRGGGQASFFPHPGLLQRGTAGKKGRSFIPVLQTLQSDFPLLSPTGKAQS